jgi:peptidyl-prolyl cis-trans isomerase B (cyclophilin B)
MTTDPPPEEGTPVPGKERQRQLAREKIQRQMAKRAEAARRRRRAQAMTGSVLAVAAVIALAGVGFAKLHHGPPTVRCSYVKPPAGGGSVVPRKVKFPDSTGVAKAGKVRVRLATNQGTLTLTLDQGKAPCTVNSFLSLARQKYFDKTPCHRLTTSGIYVLQCGDPAGQGNGGPGYQFAEEGLATDKSKAITYPAGTIAMANAGAGTTGSQFFLVYKDSQLPPNYTMFGTVSSGLGVVLKVAKAGAVKSGKPTADGAPKTPVTIQKATALS